MRRSCSVVGHGIKGFFLVRLGSSRSGKKEEGRTRVNWQVSN